MKFFAVTDPVEDESLLEEDYKSSREIGVIRIGREVLYFKVRLKVYYIPYQDITRCYRRVMMVPAHLCCGRGSLDIEHLVVEKDGKELAQIQLPGTRAAKELLKVLQEKMPDISFTCPKKEA